MPSPRRSLFMFTLLALLLCPLIGQVHGQAATITTKMGVVEIPVSWKVERVGDRIRAWSDEDSSEVVLYRIQGERLAQTVSDLASQLGISDYVRSVSREFTRDAGAEAGVFALGSLPVDTVTAAALPAVQDYPTLPPFYLEDRWFPAEYHFVAGYLDNETLFIMTARTRDMKDGPMRLAEIHRSWRLDP